MMGKVKDVVTIVYISMTCIVSITNKGKIVMCEMELNIDDIDV